MEPLISADATAAGVAILLALKNTAAAPETWGVAIDVPLMVFVAVALVFHADVMPTPGALMSTQEPKFENDARASLVAVAPTVSAAGVRAGDVLHALALSFPAATA